MTRKRITSAAVAQEVGVSRTTVSLVLNNIPNASIPAETRRKVLDAAARLNYHPNASGRRLVSGRTHMLAYVLHQSPEWAAADLFLPEVLRGLNAVTQSSGYHILFRPVDPNNPEDSYASLIYEGHVDAIILSGPQLDEPEAITLHRQNLPVVVTGHLPGYDIPSVDVNNVEGARIATTHLINLGHQRIGLITNAPRSYLASQERFDGYCDGLMAAGLPFDKKLVQEGHFSAYSGFQSMNSLLELNEPPTAVFVASDVVAFGAMRAVKERGQRIPQDIAIVGFDDVPIGLYIEPQLTTVHLPAYELGWHTGQLALQLINQEKPGKLHQFLPTELVVRASCGAA
ncbi:MAG: LacI family transcriptional regulator [Chloroflexi bacterium]|nr:LacI family transcriptional regulator [Chloroflexota bacterium]MCI0579689.1 LacI family transcriptional regulator [Chloroflexota bacterium]MCI0649576.1 LacI family transcriptional regulator [Chloroflexota bacterium]MCI0729348.1 LacI family transcriptional regulator [Chloroflexota bacterium]